MRQALLGETADDAMTWRNGSRSIALCIAQRLVGLSALASPASDGGLGLSPTRLRRSRRKFALCSPNAGTDALALSRGNLTMNVLP